MRRALVWLRRDLRLADNPALTQARACCERVIPLYIHAPEEEGEWSSGAASRWWLHHSLAALDASLQAIGSRLLVKRGASLQVLRALAREVQATHVFWNRLYEPSLRRRDMQIKEVLRADGLTVHSFNSALLREPWETVKDDGEPYRLFTAFWNSCLKSGLAGSPHEAAGALPAATPRLPSVALEELGLRPGIPWDAGLGSAWRPGETGAQAHLADFLGGPVAAYQEQRDYPGHDGTSRLSPHLHFGEIGPRQVVAALQARLDREPEPDLHGNAEVFLRELGWREFAHHLLYHFPDTPNAPLDERFAAFPWERDYELALRAWQRGRTGIPLVDAGMRELWTSGWMHNRVRMVVASLLSKNLLVPWREGARWFWDTLVDADLASNTLGWQWTAGCGADAAPYFRVFNPVLQGTRYDPQGVYVRRWLPELARLPDRYLHCPWEAPQAVLAQAGIILGVTYPAPIVDLKASRQRALERFAHIKNHRG